VTKFTHSITIPNITKQTSHSRPTAAAMLATTQTHAFNNMDQSVYFSRANDLG